MTLEDNNEICLSRIFPHLLRNVMVLLLSQQDVYWLQEIIIHVISLQFNDIDTNHQTPDPERNGTVYSTFLLLGEWGAIKHMKRSDTLKPSCLNDAHPLHIKGFNALKGSSSQGGDVCTDWTDYSVWPEQQRCWRRKMLYTKKASLIALRPPLCVDSQQNSLMEPENITLTHRTYERTRFLQV